MRHQEWAIKLPFGVLASYQYLNIRRGDCRTALFPTRHEARMALRRMNWALKPYPRVVAVIHSLEVR